MHDATLPLQHTLDHAHEAHELSFWKKYIFSTDHKIIGIQFLMVGLMFFVVGGLLAMLVRWQLGFPNDPNHPVPILAHYLGWSNGTMPADFYAMCFSMHATIMIFFVIIPLLVGTFGNYLIPLKIGAADMAFPFLNGMAFWFAMPAGAIIVASFFLHGGAARAGWTSYPDLTEITLSDTHVDYVAPENAWDQFSLFLRLHENGATMGQSHYADGALTAQFTGDSDVVVAALPAAVGDMGGVLKSTVVSSGADGLVAQNIKTNVQLTAKVHRDSAAGGTLVLTGPQNMANSLASKLKDPRMSKGWESTWPTCALLTTYLAWFMCLLFIGAYYVHVGSRAVSRTVAVILAAVGAWFMLQGTQYAVFDGQSAWFTSIIILGFSSIMGAVNYLTTIAKLRCPGMTMFRMPLSVWSLFITSILVLLATPVLASVLTMNLLDHHRLTSFFVPFNWLIANKAQDSAGGGYPLLHQHLFWFYSHPAVYIMILPAMGMVSDILAVGARKPIFGYKPMIFAIAGIAFLGFIVWAHHMFQSGLNPTLGTTFAISTMFIAVPSAIKTFNWLGTLWGGNIRYTTAMCNAIAFVAMFIIGGLSGIYMASTAVDVHIHDTYFIVAHIHYVLFGGTMFGIFGSITFWYPKMFGRMMSEKIGMLHFFLTFIFFNLTFFPMHILGIGGMARRLYDPSSYMSFAHFAPMNRFISMSAFGLGLTQILFAVNFLGSWIWGKKAPNNPWEATTLEWTETTSPPPHGNFTKVPVVHNGPYEYSSPLVEEDWLPQTRYVPGADKLKGSH